MIEKIPVELIKKIFFENPSPEALESMMRVSSFFYIEGTRYINERLKFIREKINENSVEKEKALYEWLLKLVLKGGRLSFAVLGDDTCKTFLIEKQGISWSPTHWIRIMAGIFPELAAYCLLDDDYRHSMDKVSYDMMIEEHADLARLAQEKNLFLPEKDTSTQGIHGFEVD